MKESLDLHKSAAFRHHGVHTNVRGEKVIGDLP